MADDVREFEGSLIVGPDMTDDHVRASMAAADAIGLLAKLAVEIYGAGATLNGLFDTVIHLAIDYGFEEQARIAAKSVPANLERLTAHNAGQSIKTQ